ncbi:MAG: hypothetical protein WDO24_05810 [Pseudomonadota bacterium]
MIDLQELTVLTSLDVLVTGAPAGRRPAVQVVRAPQPNELPHNPVKVPDWMAVAADRLNALKALPAIGTRMVPSQSAMAQ